MSSGHSPCVCVCGGGSSFASQLHIKRESQMWNYDDSMYEEPSKRKVPHCRVRDLDKHSQNVRKRPIKNGNEYKEFQEICILATECI